ncbi:MAG: hypothetical protein NC240_09550 [Clostridium sp.]|nr:hypothetical protein [Clostridium sp.]
MKDAKKILMKAFDIKIVNRKAVIAEISNEEFDYAKEKGIMFPYIKTVQHDECLKRISDALSRITPEDAANAFLYSLSSRKLEYRSVLGSYWYAKAIPPHASTASGSCNICQWDTYNNLSCNAEYKNHYNVLNYERYKYGGVRHTDAVYALFDLEEFLKLPKVKHTKEDEAILFAILSCVENLQPYQKVGGLRKAVTSAKLFKSNANEIEVIINILGICGILESAEHHCYDEGFMDCINRNPPELTNDYDYPVNWWKAENGINKSRFEMVFAMC